MFSCLLACGEGEYGGTDIGIKLLPLSELVSFAFSVVKVIA